MQTLVVSTEREALAYCVKYRPVYSLLFTRPSGRSIAVWMRAVNGDGELYSLGTGRKRKMNTLLMIGESTCPNQKISEKSVMRALGMNP
jgi:hypothetical protein